MVEIGAQQVGLLIECSAFYAFLLFLAEVLWLRTCVSFWKSDVSFSIDLLVIYRWGLLTSFWLYSPVTMIGFGYSGAIWECSRRCSVQRDSWRSHQHRSWARVEAIICRAWDQLHEGGYMWIKSDLCEDLLLLFFGGPSSGCMIEFAIFLYTAQSLYLTVLYLRWISWLMRWSIWLQLVPSAAIGFAAYDSLKITLQLLLYKFFFDA